MSGALVAEILDNAADHGLTHAEVRLLVCIAERARDSTRESWPGMDELCRRMGVQNDRAVGKVLQSLAGKGLEVRQPIRALDNGQPILDGQGRTMFAVKGHQTKYRLPRFKDRPPRTG